MKANYELLPELSIKYKRNAKIIAKQITCSSDIVDVLREMYDADTLEYSESAIVIYLNQANKTIGWKKVSQGGISGTVVDPRIIIGTALKIGAVSMILSHNHPSGNLKTSRADDELTYKIQGGCKFFDMRLLDHIVITSDGYYSYADDGKL